MDGPDQKGAGFEEDLRPRPPPAPRLSSCAMREANERGYECLLVEDATESYFPEFKAAILAMIRVQGAIEAVIQLPSGWINAMLSFEASLREAPQDEEFL